MPKSSPNQTNFLGGEWSKWAQGRTEDPRYSTALAKCLNAYPVEEGALPRRPGTEFICYPYLGNQPRLMNFEGETAAAYACEFTHDGSTGGWLRFIQGNTLVVENDAGSPAIISATDMGDPVKVTTSATPSTWATGDQAILFWPSGQTVANMGGLQNQVLTLTKVNATHYTLVDMNGNDVDGSAWANTVLVNAALRKVVRLATNYTTQAQLTALRLVQNEQLAIMLTPTAAPQTLSECPTFSIAQTAFVDGPYLPTPQTGTASVSAYTGAITFTAGSATFATTDTAGSGGTGTFNRHIRIFTEPAAWASGTTYAAGAYVKYNGAYWISNIASNVGYAPGSTPLISGVATAAWAPVAARGVAQWAWGTITAYSSSTVVTVTLPTGQALLTANGMSVAAGNWYLGAYCDSLGYPSCGCYQEGRLGLMGYAPNRFDFSTVTDPTLSIGSGFLCFSPTDIDGTVNDSNAISYTLNSKKLNPILWAHPDQSGVVCGTLGGEFVIQATTQGDPLTPTDIQAHQVTQYGCANTEVIQAGMSLIFVQRYQQRLMEYLADTFSQRWSGKHLNEMSKHFAATGIAEIAYQEELTPIIWARMNDGTLAGVTYRRVSRFVSENPVFSGWHGHQLGLDNGTIPRTVETMCVTAQPGGRSDRLYLGTKNSTGHHRIEVMAPLMRETDGLSAAIHVDETPAAACTPYFNSCTVAATAAANAAAETAGTSSPTGWAPDGSAALGGSTPSRSGIAGTGSTSFADLPATTLPAPGSVITAPHQFNGINFQVQEEVFFDGSTYLYSLPTHANSTSFSMSFWVQTPDIDPTVFQGVIYGSGSAQLLDASVDSSYTQNGTMNYVSFFNSSTFDSDDVQVGFTGDQGQPVFLLGTANNAGTQFPMYSFAQQATGASSPHSVTTFLQTLSTNFVAGTATNPWVHVMLSLRAPSSGALEYMLYIDTTQFAHGTLTNVWNALNGGTVIPPVSPTLSHPSITFPFSTSGFKIGAANWIPQNFYNSSYGVNTWDQQSATVSDNRAGSCFQGCMAELWIAPGQFVDWSVQANREKFHTSESDNITGLFAPVNLGPTGAAPTGTKPLIYCSASVPEGQHGAPVDWFRRNRGNGRTLATSGDLIACSDAGPGDALV